MRVCVLIDAWEPVWGGGQIHVLELCRRLAQKHGVKIDIFTRNLSSRVNKLNFPVQKKLFLGVNLFRCGPKTEFHNLFGRFIWLIIIIFQVKSQHQKKPYQLIHAHAYVSGIPALILGRILQLPVIYTVHGALNMDQKQKNLITVLEWLLLTRFRYSQEISVTRNFLKYTNVNRSVFIPNGINLSFKNIRKKIKTKKIITLLWIGRMETQKGLDILLKALSIVNQNEEMWRLLLVGDGNQRKNLEKLANKLYLKDQVEFIGYQPQDSMYQWYQKTDIFVLPSRAEGLSLVLLEAIFYGLPVIATAVGDNNYLIEPGRNGVLVKPNDPIDLAIKIEKMIKKNNFLKMHSTKNIFQIKKIFNWDSIAQDTYSVYKKYAKHFGF